jgi:CubicO group peptidase (beta-lactamase class C family)
MAGATEEPKISKLLQEKIDGGDFPSAVYLAAEKGEVRFSGALGLAVVEPVNIRAVADTIYDVASLTKVLITGLLWAKLIEKDEGYLNRPVSAFFEEFKAPDKGSVTIRHLLSHASGFTDWKPFYLMARSPMTEHAATRKEIIKLIASEPLINAVETKVVYSDLNFILLGFLLEEIYGERLGAIAQREIFTPLGLQKTLFNPLISESRENIAASEHGNSFEKQTCVEKKYDVSKYAWRTGVIWGEAHDGNAYFLNGCAGHAGLFSNAGEVFKIARQFLPASGKLLKPETCELFYTNLTQGLNEARSAAFQLAATPDSTAGETMAKNSFGHLGFTGTSLWIEPGTERIFILLTNRTHDHPPPFVNINSTRREFHRLAINALNKL